MTSEAKKACNKRYMDKLARITVWCTPEEKEQITAAAKQAGLSTNEFVKQAINKFMQ